MNKKTDKRLLSSIDYIDDKFTERAAKRIKTRPVGVSGGVSKKRMIKYVALLAACMILLGAAIPIATSLINRLPSGVIDPSASNAETTAPEAPPEVGLPEEYFGHSYLESTGRAFEYEGQFIYCDQKKPMVWAFGSIVKYDPTTDKVSSVCLDTSCSHSYGECPLAPPEASGWSIKYMEVFGDWIIYDYSYAGADKVVWDTPINLYNLKTGEHRIVAQATTSENSYDVPVSYVVINQKVYISISSRLLESLKGTGYIVSYDPATGQTTYLCEMPEGMGLIGISNKRFFFMNSENENWSTDHKGENLTKEETLDFYPVAVNLTYAYNTRQYQNTGVFEVYDIVTDSTFTIEFPAKLRSMAILSDKLLFTTYKSEKTATGTVLRLCDARGENQQIIFESESLILTPQNIVGNYVKCYSTENNVIDHYIINIETGEMKQIPHLD